MAWSPQQEAALAAVKAWALDRNAPQLFRLFGFAGTGKTTIAQEVREMVRGSVLYAAYTGKAALVMHRKGCVGASTIHSLIYKPSEDNHGRTIFTRNYESPLYEASVLCVDECSMVDDVMLRDLLSFGTKVLVLGDPFQLPPISGTGALTSQAPDVLLTEIHRQAADNPIIRMSLDIREGRPLGVGSFGDSRVAPMRSLSTEDIKSGDIRLTGTNATRRNWNTIMRRLLGLPVSDEPVIGDRVICLRNNKDKGLLNGSLWDVTGTRSTWDDRTIGLDLRSDDGAVSVSVDAFRSIFRGEDVREIPYRERQGIDEFDFGTCITTHKAQGSQWPHVVVNDESGVFREHASRWLYTAVTRASERVTIAV